MGRWTRSSPTYCRPRARSQVVLLAVPIYATLDLMEQLSGVLGPEHLITDVGSTKAQITEAAGRLYNTPERAGFLPGHPMAGPRKKARWSRWAIRVFRGAVWLFTDDPAWERSPVCSNAGCGLA